MARFVELDEEGDEEPSTDDFYEYLVNHEIYIDDGPKFHICSAHPAARAVVKAGRIPASFECPRADERCPMRALLDMRPGCDVKLSLVRACAGAAR